MIYAVKTMSGQEKNLAQILANKAEKEDLNIYSILATETLKGYLIIEAESESDVKELIKGIPRIRKVLPGVISIDELEQILSPRKIIDDLEKGYIVEIIAGPFKGERAKIIRVDKNKEEVTVELENAAVPIPITLPVESVKVISKKKEF